MSLDVTYRVQIPHRAGQLAAVASVIAEHQGLIGDVVTVNLGRDASIREITVEVRDTSQAWDLATDLNTLPGVNVLWHHDRAFMRHDGGKLQITALHPVTTVQEMRDIYTPGVARICSAIAENPELAGRYTMIGRTVAIVTNGSRVLGLGDIGPVAAMPVMEGKAVFYDQCAGLSAMPILLDAPDPDDVRRDRHAHRADVRRDPPRGHLGAGVLRDRGAADRGAPAAGHARRRPRDGRRHAGRRDRGLQAGRPAPRSVGRRPARPRRRRLRHRGADQGRRRAARPGVRPQRGIAPARARPRDRGASMDERAGAVRRRRRDDRPPGPHHARTWSALAR